MSDRYDPSRLEPKWQGFWDKHNTFATRTEAGLDKRYILDMFPYPSGSGLHVGHPEGYTATDIVARYYRAKGFAVLHPMGWDAFGLPAEQHAINTGTHPRETTQTNIENFRRQLKALGLSYDWTREVDTTDPGYFRWTQWIFLQLFKKGLAYQEEVPVNWCPELGTVLANEEVKDGRSERGDHPVVRVPLRQWMLKITAFAERLLEGLDHVDWPKGTRVMQKEWIGRSEGAEVDFKVEGHPDALLQVFTTRPDTLFGATFMVIAPEHPLLGTIMSGAQKSDVDTYRAQAQGRSDLERTQSKVKTGVFSGAYALNPVNNERVPIYVADYVLMGYGTGAIMAVPGHDERDFEFAKKYGLTIREVVSPDGKPRGELQDADPRPGVAVNSGAYDGMPTSDAKTAIIADLEKTGSGRSRIQFKLRDWVFSRQRYWGEPIPIYFPVDCDGDPRTGANYTVRFDTPHPVPEEELPLVLPDLDDFKPGDDPAGPLARAVDWRFFQRDGQWFARETNTMPQWAGSCWYYLRFIDPHNADALVGNAEANRWLPVDLYIGGAEHAVLHLLYARFWHLVLRDEGLFDAPEPFQKLIHQGMILGEMEYTLHRDPSGAPVSADAIQEIERDDNRIMVSKADQSPVSEERLDESEVEKAGGAFVLRDQPQIRVDARAHKMSKSRGNVVNPDRIIEQFGADAMRLYEMSMGPLEATKPWSTASIQGSTRFLDRVWAHATGSLVEEEPKDELKRLMHQTIKKVTEDIESLRFNTAISAMMQFNNALSRLDACPRIAIETLVTLLHPFAPHIAEELWERLGHEPSIQNKRWPNFDEAWVIEPELEIPVQINGKKRGVVHVPPGSDEPTVLAKAQADAAIAKYWDGKEIARVIWVQDRILTLVVKG
ncbi:MAG: leucine--tRNA ligase [Myxococcota bacterium]